MATTFLREFDLNSGLDDGVGGAITFARTGTVAHHFVAGNLANVGANVARLLSTVWDGSSHVKRGLLIEKASENLMPSDNFQDADWGVIRMTKESTETRQNMPGQEIQDDTGTNNTHLIVDQTSITNAVQYVFSWHARVSDPLTMPYQFFQTTAIVSQPWTFFDIENQANGATQNGDTNGVQVVGPEIVRCWTSFTADAATANRSMQIQMAEADNDNAFPGTSSNQQWVYAPQIELGAYPSSFMLDTAVGARGADSATAALVPTATTTIYVEGMTGLEDGVLCQIDDGTENERFRIERIGTAMTITVTDGGVAQAVIDAGDVADETYFRLAVRFEANNFAASLDGAAVVTDGAGTIPTMTTIRIGHDTVAGEEWGGYIGKIRVENTSRTDTELVNLSARGIGGSNIGHFCSSLVTNLQAPGHVVLPSLIH